MSSNIRDHRTFYTRREFMTTFGCIVGGVGLGVRTLSAAEVGTRSADSFFDGPVDDPMQVNQFKTLAQHALEAARQGGASYADIRLSQRYALSVSLFNGIPSASIETNISYGVRAMVNGAIAFDYGNVPTLDAVVATARNAVTQARGFAALDIEKVERAPAPIVQAEWATPYEIDPFRVPILEQGDLLGALNAPKERVEGASAAPPSFSWEREVRVCATSEGSLTTQTFLRSRPRFSVGASWLGSVSLDVPGFRGRQAGYEMMLAPAFPDRIKELTEQAKRYAKLPTRAMDVGRYPVVLDGPSMAMTLVRTVGPALQMDRVLGLEADASGTSFLAPPQDILGTRVFSPELSVTVGRPLDGLSGAKWDDECVESEMFPAIMNGHVVDYITDRQTSPALAGWYQKQGKAVKSRGYAVASRTDRPLVVGAGHLVAAPSASKASVEDLCQGIRSGLLILNASDMVTDQQLTSGFFFPGGCLLLEVKDAKVVGRVEGVVLQFKMRTFWTGLTAVGDSRTTAPFSTQISKGQPWQRTDAEATAPAGRFTSVDVLSIRGL